MKKFLLLLALGLFLATPLRADWTADYARLLKKYVTSEGVRYAQWKANAEDLKAMEEVVAGIGSASAEQGTGREALAFYLNAYNAWILREALAKYPTRSIKDPLFTFFLTNRLLVAGRKLSFNTLEKDLIRARFQEPRVHFALNCASKSCPPLRNEPYSGAKLETQLEEQSRAFIGSSRGLLAEGAGVRLSKIFEWYKDDFDATGGVLSFINKRLPKPLPPTVKISYQEYDWSLNEAR